MAAPPLPAAPARRWRWLLAGMAIVALVFARALLPTALRIGVEEAAIRTLELPATLRNVDLDLLRGGFVIEGLTVGRRGDVPVEGVLDPGTALLRWERASARISWLGLLRGEIHLRELSVDGARIQLEQEPDGSIDPLGRNDAETPAEPAEVAEADPEAEVVGEPGWPLLLDRLTLRDLAVTLVEADRSGPPRLEFQFEELRLADVKFHDGALGLGAISIEGPRLQVRRDLTALAGPAAESEESPAEDGSRRRVTAAGIDEIAIGRAEFTLRTDGPALDVTLALRARDLTFSPGDLFPLEVELAVAGGSIDVAGRLGLFPPSFDGTVRWSDLSLPPLAAMVWPELSAWLTTGSSGGELRLQATLANEGTLQASGTIRVDALHFAGPEEEIRVAWQALEIALAEAHLPLRGTGGGRVKLDRLAVEAPDIRYTLPMTALDRLVAVENDPAPETEDPEGDEDASPSREPEAEAPAAPAPGPEITLAELSVQGGRLEFVDQSVQPTHRTQVADLWVDGRDLRWPGPDIGRIHVKAALPQGSQLEATGTLRGGNGDLSLALSRLTLPPFNPYAVGAGLHVDAGAASVESTVELRGSRTRTESTLLLHGLELSPESTDGFHSIFGVSLDLTLALLKDVDGKIELPLRITLEETTTRADLLPLVGAALKHAVLNALTSPLKILGAILEKGEESSAFSFDPIRADPGVPEPVADESERIRGLATLLASRPGVALTLRGRTGDEDRLVVARRIFIEHVLADENLPPLRASNWLERRRIIAAVRARASGAASPLEPADEALLTRWIEEIEVPAERTRALALERARTLRSRVLEYAADLDPERVRLADEIEDGTPAVVLDLGPA